MLPRETLKWMKYQKCTCTLYTMCNWISLSATFELFLLVPIPYNETIITAMKIDKISDTKRFVRRRFSWKRLSRKSRWITIHWNPPHDIIRSNGSSRTILITNHVFHVSYITEAYRDPSFLDPDFSKVVGAAEFEPHSILAITSVPHISPEIKKRSVRFRQ